MSAPAGFRGHPRSVAPCASGQHVNAAGEQQPECSWCTAKRLKLGHILPRDMPLQQGVDYALPDKEAFLVKLYDFVTSGAEVPPGGCAISPHIAQRVIRWGTAYSALPALIQLKILELQTSCTGAVGWHWCSYSSCGHNLRQ